MKFSDGAASSWASFRGGYLLDVREPRAPASGKKCEGICTRERLNRHAKSLALIRLTGKSQRYPYTFLTSV